MHTSEARQEKVWKYANQVEQTDTGWLPVNHASWDCHFSGVSAYTGSGLGT